MEASNRTQRLPHLTNGPQARTNDVVGITRPIDRRGENVNTLCLPPFFIASVNECLLLLISHYNCI